MAKTAQPKFNPYEALGVGRDASPSEIKAAHRRAVRTAHPDAGGTRADFDNVQKARVLLLDDRRRRRFDETGEIEDTKPDNDRAHALTIIQAFVDKHINEYIQSGLDPEMDPTNMDMMTMFREATEDELASLRGQIPQHEHILRNVAGIAARFDGPAAESIRRAIELRMEKGRAAIKTIREAITMRERALELAENISFRYEAAVAGDYDNDLRAALLRTRVF